MEIIIRQQTPFARLAKEYVESVVRTEPSLFRGLDYVFLEQHLPKPTSSKMFRTGTEGYYTVDRRGQSSIVLSLEHFATTRLFGRIPRPLRPMARIIGFMLLFLAVAIASPLLLVLMLYQMIKDRNLKIYYLVVANRIPRKFRKLIKDEVRLHFLSHLLFYVGIHDTAQTRPLPKKYGINYYEAAYKVQVRCLHLIAAQHGK